MSDVVTITSNQTELISVKQSNNQKTLKKKNK